MRSHSKEIYVMCIYNKVFLVLVYFYVKPDDGHLGPKRVAFVMRELLYNKYCCVLL